MAKIPHSPKAGWAIPGFRGAQNAQGGACGAVIYIFITPLRIQPMYVGYVIGYVHSLCTKPMDIAYVHSLCTQPMYIAYVHYTIHNLCK